METGVELLHRTALRHFDKKQQEYVQKLEAIAVIAREATQDPQFDSLQQASQIKQALAAWEKMAS